jgi:hypothetical protein
VTPYAKGRRFRASLAAALISVPAVVTSYAQINSFVGTWQGIAVVNGTSISINLVMGPDQRYSEQLQSGSLRTLEAGYYTITNQSVITFQVVDWDPKTQPVYHPTGTVGGYYTQEPTPKPPGGTFRFQFTSPNSVRLQDVNFGGIITFNRIQ